MNILRCVYVPTVNQFAHGLQVLRNFLPHPLIFAFKTGGCMVLFGIAVRLFVFCFVFCVVEMLTVLGVFIVRWGRGGGSWSLGFIRGLCLCLCPCLCLEVARLSLVRGGGHQKKLCGVPPSVNFEWVVLVVLRPDVREAN